MPAAVAAASTLGSASSASTARRFRGVSGGALPCPDTAIYAPFPQNSGAPQTCQGGEAHNSFYGAGQINALKAVSGM